MIEKVPVFSRFKLGVITLLSCILFLFLGINPIFSQSNPDEKLAIQFYQNGEYEKARELFEKIFDKKQDTYIYYYYYRTLIELREYKDLEKIVKKQQKAFPLSSLCGTPPLTLWHSHLSLLLYNNS